MKHRFELYGAIVCMLLIMALLFIVGMRSGLHDSAVTNEAELQRIEAMYMEQINNLNLALEKEREIERVVYEYKPLPTDYESIGDVQPAETDAVIIAKTLWGEYRNSENYNQCSAVVWCILNRVDAGYGSIEEVCTGGQFHGYNPNNPVDAGLYRVVCGVLARWSLEKTDANTDVGRTLPSGYLWFEGNGTTNTFRNAYKGGEHITP